MNVKYLVTELLNDCVNAAQHGGEEQEVKEAVADWLREADFYVAEGNGELLDLALHNTRLVDPQGQ